MFVCRASGSAYQPAVGVVEVLTVHEQVPGLPAFLGNLYVVANDGLVRRVCAHRELEQVLG